MRLWKYDRFRCSSYVSVRSYAWRLQQVVKWFVWCTAWACRAPSYTLATWARSYMCLPVDLSLKFIIIEEHLSSSERMRLHFLRNKPSKLPTRLSISRYLGRDFSFCERIIVSVNIWEKKDGDTLEKWIMPLTAILFRKKEKRAHVRVIKNLYICKKISVFHFTECTVACQGICYSPLLMVMVKSWLCNNACVCWPIQQCPYYHPPNIGFKQERMMGMIWNTKKYWSLLVW